MSENDELRQIDEEIEKELEELEEYYLYNKWELYYPDEDLTFLGQTFPARRKYKRYLQFFAAGKDTLVRAALCGNQIGKTEGLCGYETMLHVTGLYPDWWEGKRFNKPVTWLCAGKTSTTTRDLLQFKLFGDSEDGDESQKAIDKFGTGLIPKSRIKKVRFQAGGASGAIDTAYIESVHSKKVMSKIIFRSYEQGRKAAEGLVLDGVWVDEEPGMEFFSEAQRGLLNTDGIFICSFTPLEGVTETIIHLLGEDVKLPDYDPDLYGDEVERMMRKK